MTEHHCSCGYDADSPEDLALHFGEMFIPADDVAPDGQAHTEAARDKGTPVSAPRVCRCGFTSSDIDGLDWHLIDVFTPADRIGLDGVKHAPASAAQQ